MASSDGIGEDDTLTVLEGSHTHMNWVFTQPGNYEIDVFASGFLDTNGNGTFDDGIDAYTESGITTLYFQMNATGDPTPVTLPADVAPQVAIPFALPEIVMPEPGYAYNTLAADLNGDGLPDALVNGFADVTFLTEVVWAPNLGDGTFGERQTILPGTSDFIANVFPVDVDQDGDLDVVVAGGDALHYHINDGTGNFSEPVEVAGPGPHRDAFAGDLDGDGDVDFASVTNTGLVQWFRNDGDSFVAAEIATGLAGGNAMTAFDADGDGDTDLFVGSNDVEQITMFTNDGVGGFSSSILADSAIDVRNLYHGDLDADGRIDLVSTAYFDGELAYFRNQGDGTFDKQVIDTNDSGVFGGDVGDVDGDGDLDIVAAGFDDTSVSWYANDGSGGFGGRQIVSFLGSGNFSMYDASLADFTGDGQTDIISGDVDNPFAIVVHENQFGFFDNQMIAPEDGIYLQDSAIDLRVHFGVPVDVTGTPGIELQIGDQTVTAEYFSGTGTPTLTFRHVVEADDADLDGPELASMMVVLPAGAAMTDPVGNDVDRTLPAVDLTGVVINGSAPRVASITRLDPAATSAESVRFAVTFNEPVTGVTTDTFAVNVSADLTGAAVTGVTGDGAEYIVTVDTGIGSGVLGLADGSVGTVDLQGNPLATPVLGGEVYTLQRRPARTIDDFFTGSHADVTMRYRNNLWMFEAPGSDLDVSEVLVVGGPDSVVPAPTGDEFSFLGAEPGSNIYLLPQSGAPPTVPDLGITSNVRPRSAFASYMNADPRVDSDAAWIEMQLLGMRGPEGAQFSLYNSGAEPTVWMASSDGIDETDTLFTPAGSHSHYNWAFTHAGHYEIDVFASGFLDTNGNGTFDEGIDAYTESGITTLYFQINESGDPTPVTLPADRSLPAVVPFALPQSLGNLDSFSTAATGDIDNDGDLDLLVGAFGADTLAWLENVDGTLGPLQTISDSAMGVWFVELSDLDNDGDLDALFGSFFDGRVVMHEFDDGSFGPAQQLDDGISGAFLKGVDLDGDGRRDIVAAADGGIEVYWYKNLGEGAFGPRQTVITGLTSQGGYLPSDVDSDGDVDLIFNDYASGKVTWYLNDGTGSFDNGQEIDGGGNLWSTGDLNGDGREDLLIVSFDTGLASWHPVLGDGVVGAAQPLPIDIDGAYSLTAGDFDADGDLDVAATTFGNTAATVWVENLGDGIFGPQRVISMSDGQVSTLIAGDFDADGDADLVANSFSLSESRFYENRLGDFENQIIAPADGTYPAGQNIDVNVHFGYPVELSGTPSVMLDIGGQMVEAAYLSGDGTPTLLFRYTVVESDRDDDGIELVSTSVNLHGGSISDPAGNPADLMLPVVDMPEVLVNGSTPSIESIKRVSSNPTAAHEVTFHVTFSEVVTGVDTADFGPTVDGVDGASVIGLSGSGAEYAVTVATGAGSGIIGLEVLDSATIEDGEGNPLVEGFVGG
ncbi:MAG: FG-GAP-like repeat-containing protein, partial [Planctomycetota bacterium]